MYLEEVDAALCDHGEPEEVEGRANADGELVPVGATINNVRKMFRSSLPLDHFW